jgi:hypothetical protein
LRILDSARVAGHEPTVGTYVDAEIESVIDLEDHPSVHLCAPVRTRPRGEVSLNEVCDVVIQLRQTLRQFVAKPAKYTAYLLIKPGLDNL